MLDTVTVPVVRICIALPSFVLATWGMFLIERSGRQRTHQNRILIHLSIALLVALAGAICYWTLALLGEKSGSFAMEIIIFIMTCCRWPGYCILTMLTVDRLIGIKFTLKYNLVLTKRRVHYILIFSWSSSVFVIILRIFFATNTILDLHFRFFFPIADGVYLCFVLYAYSYILHALTKRSRQFKTQFINTNMKHRNERKVLLMSVIIVCLFLFLVVLPEIVTAVLLMAKGHVAEVFRAVDFIMVNLYGLSIPLTNIFMQRDIRKKLRKRMSGIFSSRNELRTRYELESQSTV